MSDTRTLSLEDVRAVSPALERFMIESLLGDVWVRPDLSRRDRSIATLAVLVARNQMVEMPSQLNTALDNGVTPGEISEIITHLAFYSGWSNALSAVNPAKDVFAARGVAVDQLPAAAPQLLPIDQPVEDRREATARAISGTVAPGVVDYTRDLLFRDLWLRPDLAPRDRSLVTVSGLIAAGHVAQVTFHLNRAMDNGLTRAEASELLTHLAFYTGWPNVFSAIPIVKAVFESRTE
jgi:4-carboxymuconolactone decarboxylase